MRRLSCPVCSQRVFFNDQTCLNCGGELTYNVAVDAMTPAMQPCSNRFDLLCNWVAGADSVQCASCALDEDRTGPTAQLTTFEAAKRRVLRQLALVGLDPGTADPPLRFALHHGTDDDPVTIGHADGLVTLDTGEADAAQRERVRARLGEPYRTPLGHVRHEVGHWHWQAYVAPDALRLEQFRELFGDERADYSAALAAHYQGNDSGAWRTTHLSHYATAHPWEDYAESFAHLLHMMDMVETAVAEGFINGGFTGVSDLFARWAPLTVSLNEMAHSMGTPEPYPFAPPAAALRKMVFVYDVINGSRHARDLSE
ncbi:MAG: putative zinc-binding metallopeptidase [Actinobacteria bacterium]|nr:putative zinc-binding metallopeptidase [Actinomycetota bacterium]